MNQISTSASCLHLDRRNDRLNVVDHLLVESLLRYGMKRTVVASVTALSEKRIKAVASGRNLSTRRECIRLVDNVISTNAARSQAALLCEIIHAVSADAADVCVGGRDVAGHVILTSHRLLMCHMCDGLVFKKPFSINETYVIYIAHRAGRLTSRMCARCATPYIAALDGFTVGGCPNCEPTWRQRRPAASASCTLGLFGTHSSPDPRMSKRYRSWAEE